MATTHDYTAPGWGHNVNFMRIEDAGLRAHIAGWGHGVKKGDYLLLANRTSTTRYRVASIEYKSDPRDMWFADIEFAPRQVAA